MNLFNLPPNLSPRGRAFFRLAESFACIAFINATLALSQYLSQNQQINWSQLGTFVAAQSLLAVALSATKYLRAQNDPQLISIGTLVEQLANEVAKRLSVQTANLQTDIMDQDTQPRPAVK